MTQQTTLFCNQQTISGPGSIRQLSQLISQPGLPTLLFSCRSFLESEVWQQLQESLSPWILGIITVSHEASPQQLDEWISEWRGKAERVVAIGGGSVLDAGKAFSTLCLQPLPTVHYLEKIGDTPLDGKRLPLIAVPTTAGTGSEATQNSVVTDQQHYQVKASLRHPRLVPDIAILDPLLLRHAPAAVLTRCGIDAFTHLFEAWLSSKSSFFSRQFSLQGMLLFIAAWPDLDRQDQRGDEAREKMMMASWLGGLSLSMAGLGVIHGIAGEAGAIMPWHHGEVCGRLLLPFLALCAEEQHPELQARLTELHHHLFPSQKEANPARYLAKWLQKNTVCDFWQSPPSLSPAQLEKILSTANSKNSLITYNREQLLFMIRESWPVIGE
ncbi:iron-containing alcohol dehydrogenase [Tatumella citrea]|uniref:Alcohol dehydrogenase n=1 Tax=Tatumella citrea TaxID=53336 RepID=A0A1Y0LIZ4_TATCI|nr:iron-containing alcohol dehydrogenase [Tatumella citrea]ARU93592.1 alcohol dehydrogenase [Tatumella citrea]ARU97630.1 alcohol dehydrogenase [Tatumella citrea]